ncbi:YHYH protein [Hymenobacter daecheongensis DSM 21074]|uniref:YHYH protein n=1 Tax=Hymenobacter daecheongensis DSM 21074 TaxID=1121955 RepID=A0A1M6A927_9BACT|nr:YHYH protein [Hymenobacter daecheongensis]SHI32949.1 YHYH protein [Hymenobacter daecheongensis DSM 21074]
MRLRLFSLLTFLLLAAAAHAQPNPQLASWLLNTTGATGFNGLPANVQRVQYSTTSVYVSCSAIPSYTAGYVAPASGQGTPATNSWFPQPTRGPVAQGFTFRVPRVPQPNAGAAINIPPDHVGLWLNGVTMFNGQDAASYNNQGVWFTDAVVNEGIGFDRCNGHPNMQDEYHTHLNPTCLYNDRDSTRHSPIIGWAFDGYPIYGTYGYRNANGTGGVKSMKSSYRQRSITQRRTLSDGTVLSASQYGPPVSAQNPIGKYVEDNEYVAGRGDLDASNGRFCVTPEYPQGTYAYFVTLNSLYEGAYPYVLGKTYYGVAPNWGNFGGPNSGHVAVNEPVTTYLPLAARAAIGLTVRCFPNPAPEQLTVELPASAPHALRAWLLDGLGQPVRSAVALAVGRPAVLDVRGLAAGLYFLWVEGEGVAFSEKIVVGQH